MHTDYLCVISWNLLALTRAWWGCNLLEARRRNEPANQLGFRLLERLGQVHYYEIVLLGVSVDILAGSW